MKVTLENVIKTFTKEQILNYKNYFEVLRLHRKNISKSNIFKKVNVSEDKIYQWRYTSIKPNSVKTIEEAKRRGYFKPISKKKLDALAYLIGYNLGDGNVSRNLCNVWFYGINSDLEDIRTLLLNFNVNPVIYTYKINNGKMAVHDRVFSRFLVCLGAVIGDKTMGRVSVPGWILDSGNASLLKKRFLQGYCDSELSIISQVKGKSCCYNSLKVYTSKHNCNLDNGFFFFGQLRELFREFSVLTSDVKFDRKYLRKRDGSEMQQMYFVIPTNYLNLYNFIRNIGFRYNAKRKTSSVTCLNSIKDKLEHETEKVEKYELALKLSQEGLSAYKIAKMLDIETYHVKNWLYFKKKPRLYNQISSS
ncbi:MAG: LAGLIDADG family homing endonuclease [Candidatus Woesearchaeota archaeon]